MVSLRAPAGVLEEFPHKEGIPQHHEEKVEFSLKIGQYEDPIGMPVQSR